MVRKECAMTPEDWNIMLGLSIVGRIACITEIELSPSFHDYNVMLYRSFGLDYREETTV